MKNSRGEKLLPNINSYYNEQQILKIWDVYVKNKHLAYWASNVENKLSTIFSSTNSMSVLKETGILIKNDGNLFYNNSKKTVSICGAVDYLSNDLKLVGYNGITHDIEISLRQLLAWNTLNKGQQISNHIIIFPYHITVAHWCLGTLELKLNDTTIISSEVKIYNPLPEHGGTVITEVVRKSIEDTIQKTFNDVKLLSSKNNYGKQQNDGASCGVISAENGKDIIDGGENLLRISTSYEKGATTLRNQHLTEVSDKRFYEMQAKDEHHSNPEVTFLENLAMVRKAWEELVSRNKGISTSLSNKLNNIDDPVTVSQIVRDIFKDNKEALTKVKVAQGGSIYSTFFAEEDGNLKFNDGTVDTLWSFTRGIRVAAKEEDHTNKNTYSSDNIGKILKARLEQEGITHKDPIFCLTPVNEKTALSKLLREEKIQHKNQNRVILIPYDNGDLEWIGIAIHNNEDNEEASAYYYYNSNKPHLGLQGHKDITAIYGILDFSIKGGLYQSGKSSSGLVAIENLVMDAVRWKRAPRELNYSYVKQLHADILSKDFKNTPSKSKAQISKSNIFSSLANILAVNPSEDTLVDIEFNENENNLITLGRPKVIGSASKQMRHVTPYAFIEQLIESKVKNASSAMDLLQSLKSSLKVIIRDDKGICLTEDEYIQYDDLQNIRKIKLITHDKNSNKDNVYYLIDKHQLNNGPVSFKNMGRAQELYISKKQKFIDSMVSYLQTKIGDDPNTIHIFCEALCRFILTLFNSKPCAAFPEEGNTLNYEIRLYNSSDDTKAPKNKKFIVLTSNEISDKIQKNEDLNEKIRIVNNEGYVVKRTIEALSCLHNILKCSDTALDALHDKLLEYNERYNQKLIGINGKLHDELEADNLVANCKWHIAKHLYFVFDFKPLENVVFVPITQSDTKNGTIPIKVFPSASANKSAVYGVKNGKIYREEQINTAKGYNDDVEFRKEELDINLLAQKIIDHLIIGINLYPHFAKYTSKILMAFSSIISTYYNDDVDSTKSFKTKLKSAITSIEQVINIDNNDNISNSEVDPYETKMLLNDQQYRVLDILGESMDLD